MVSGRVGDVKLEGQMSTPWAIIAGAAMIAIAVAVTNHWQVIPVPNQGITPTVIRLNRWTGLIDMCVVDPNTMRNPNSFAGAELPCGSE
jgi:hypothetical protein